MLYKPSCLNNPLYWSLCKGILQTSSSDNISLEAYLSQDEENVFRKNHITDVWQSKISNVSLKANYARQTDGQKKQSIGVQAFTLPKNACSKSYTLLISITSSTSISTQTEVEITLFQQGCCNNCPKDDCPITQLLNMSKETSVQWEFPEAFTIEKRVLIDFFLFLTVTYHIH